MNEYYVLAFIIMPIFTVLFGALATRIFIWDLDRRERAELSGNDKRP